MLKILVRITVLLCVCALGTGLFLELRRVKFPLHEWWEGPVLAEGAYSWMTLICPSAPEFIEPGLSTPKLRVSLDGDEKKYARVPWAKPDCAYVRRRRHVDDLDRLVDEVGQDHEALSRSSVMMSAALDYEKMTWRRPETVLSEVFQEHYWFLRDADSSYSITRNEVIFPEEFSVDWLLPVREILIGQYYYDLIETQQFKETGAATEKLGEISGGIFDGYGIYGAVLENIYE